MPAPPAPPAAIVFDLDGTLIDSLADIGSALNARLELLGLPTHSLDALRYMVGEGLPKLCERAIGETAPQLVARLVDLTRAHYRTRLTQETRPYDGVRELIAQLSRQGTPLAVLSNKPHDLSVRVVETLWPEQPFELVYGHDAVYPRKPDPGRLLNICEQLGQAPDAVWMVGDTPTDIQTALAAGTVPVGVTWGFRRREDLSEAGAEYIVDHPHELNGATH